MSRIKGNLGVERVVLSGVCQFGKEAYYDVQDLITTSSFSLDANQALYKCLEKVLEQVDKPDITSILAASDSLGLSAILTKNKIDIEYIRSLFNFPIKLENVRPHAKQLAKIEIIQKEQAALMNAYNELGNLDGTESISQILGIPEEAIFQVTNELNNRNDDAPKQIIEGAKLRLEALAAEPIENIGVPTCFAIYNKLIGNGIRPGVAVIGARPKVGKSSVCINVALHTAENLNIPTLILDTEMSQEEQQSRILACHSEVDIDLIENGSFALYESYADKVSNSLDKLKNIPLVHKFIGGKSFEEILGIIRRWIHQTVGFNQEGKLNKAFLVYDYLKLLDVSMLDKCQEYQAIGFQLMSLSDFCKQHGLPCLAFVQLNRDAITKDTSDIISQSDRILWFATSISVLKKISQDEANESGFPKYCNRRLSILESRFGENIEDNDCIIMKFDGKHAKITEVDTKFNLLRKRDTSTGFKIND